MNKSSSVGRGRPPAHSRFRPGTSGNPTGRPKGARGFKAELLKELAELVSIGDGDRGEVTKQRAIIIALLREAMKGDLRAVDTVMRACVSPQDDAVEEEDAPEDRAIIQALGRSAGDSTPETGEQ